MIEILLWQNTTQCVIDALGTIPINEKPALSFEYEAIRFYNNEKIYITQDGTEHQLTEEQQEEIRAFITATRTAAGILKPSISSSGEYLGTISAEDPRVSETVPFSPPNGDDWVWEKDKNDWVRAYHYDINGYPTVSRAGNSAGFTKTPYPSDKHPIAFKFDTAQNNWIIDNTRPELLNIVRNKIVFDALLEYIRFNLAINSNPDSPSMDYSYLLEIVNTVSNMQSWRENNISDANVRTTLSTVDSDFQNLIQSTSNTDQTILEMHDKAVVFHQTLAKIIKDNYYTVNKQTLEETVIDDFINNQ